MTAAAFDNILARRLNTFVALSRKELKVLGELQKNPFRAQRGQLLLQEGQPDPKVFILQTGWGYGYKVLPNGSRQIISLASYRQMLVTAGPVRRRRADGSTCR
jgi:CRP-like cAMP-binding protein